MVRPWIALIAAVWLVSLWFTYVEPGYRMRLIVSNLLMACLFGVHAWLILQQGSTSFARILTVGVLVGNTVV